MAATGKALNECPTNVKEALEWLTALEQGGGAQGCLQVIKDKNIIKGFDGKEAQELCQKTREFLSAIRNGSSSTYKTNGWSTMCQSSGGNCCGADSACQCKSNSSCDGCCPKCPKQICARIFCLIVPVVRNVLMYLYGKCNTPRPEKGQNGDWASQKINNGSNGQDDLKQFMEACGFEAGQLEDKGGYTLAEKEGTLTKLGGALWTVNKNLTESLEKNNATETFLKDASKPSNAKSPNSICDLLLWLQFLPYSTKYSEVKTKLNTLIPKNGASQTIDTYLKEFTSSIPMLFHVIEGKGKDDNGKKGSSIFQHIATLAKCQYYYDEKYYNKPEHVVKMLVSAMPVLYWSIEQMKNKCTQGDQCTTSVKECDKMWKFLSLMGWKKDSSDSDHNIEGNMKCGLFKKYIEKELIGTNGKGRLNEIKKLIETEWKKENGSTGFTSSGQYLPRTIYEMLIWLMGLPVSDKFKDLKTQIQSLNNGVQLNDVMPEFTKILFEVPNLFLTLNGDLSGMLGELFKCNGIEGNAQAYKYGDGSECLKIFSAIVAILYPVIRYLQQRCNGNGQAFANGESWQNKKTNENELKEYLVFMGFEQIPSSHAVSGSAFHTGVLMKIFGDVTGQNGGNEKLNKLYQCALAELKKNSTTGSPTTPTTIRQMMLWLIGLPVTSQYGNGSSGLMNTVTQKAQAVNGPDDLKTKITNGHDSLESNLSHSIVGMMTVINQIEGGLKSVLEFLQKGFQDGSNKFKYEQDQAGLFTSFTTYVTSVHVQLRFLYVMCKTGKDQGGWKDCHYAMRSYSSSSGVPGTILCKCHRGGGVACGKEPLRNFLTNNGNGTGQNGKNTFKLCQNGDSKKTEHLQMGFRQYETPQSQVVVPGQQNTHTGNEIYTHLKEMLDDIPTPTTPSTKSTTTPTKPLSLLTQYCVAIGQVHPSTLGDLFAFFANLGTKWDSLKLYGQNGEKFEQKLTEELTEYEIGTLGEKPADEELETMIKALFNDQHKDHTNDKSLMSLMCSTNTNTSGTCAPYMKSLSQGLYHYYLSDVKQPGDFPFLQYLYDMLRKLLDKMKELQKEFDACECCKNTGKSCTDLISCQYAHPILYKFGFVFGEPKALKSGDKKCTDIKTQLGVVLSCTKESPSALFSAFECVIQVTYSILLEKAKGKVNEKYNTSNGDSKTGELKSTNTEMNKAFTLYVENAMYQSYPKLICTFACKVFDDKHTCGDNCKGFQSKIAAPKTISPASPSAAITVSKSTVTSITAVIPQYTAPVIDPYHYRTFQKTIAQTEGSSPGKASDHYSFSDAIDFHVRGANCIRPTPVALRSVIDWILRVTTGAIAMGATATQEGTENNNSNEQIKHLSEEIKKVFKECGVSVTTDAEVNGLVTALVDGLRKFVGYQERSTDVISKVGEALGNAKEANGNGVKKLLGDRIKSIEGFIGTAGKANFATELGKALMKGRYEGTFKQKREGFANTLISTFAAFTETITGMQEPLEQRTFKDVVDLFTKILTSQHTYCKSQLNCTEFQPTNSVPSTSASSVTAAGLSDLHTFLSELKTFAALWTTIGKKGNGSSGPSSSLVRHFCIDVEAEIYCELKNKIDPFVTSYFSRLQMHINLLGKCAQKVNDLENKNGNPSSDSTKYRTKITELINELKEALEYLKGIPLDYVVDGSNKLALMTKEKVDIAIPYSIKTAIVESVYCKIQCSQNSDHTRHQGMSGVLCIETLIEECVKRVDEKLTEFKSYLDDLKQLCQWLYRMGQLYAHGLKGFVESLIEHLKHIIKVIRWIEKLKLYMTIVLNSNNAEAAEVQQSITAGASTIAKLLSSYALKDADKSLNIDTDKASTYRGFLSEIRLLALDRYTLQVWQDECNPNDGRPSAIKDWITFEGGIVRHSDLEAIKVALKNLTRIDYDSSPSASPSASHRIHNFHAICVIQKFSYEAPIAELERSLEELKGIKEKLEGVKEKCDANGGNLSSDQDVQKFSESVSKFLKDPYGIYSFAKFVHTIMGPNIFSAVIAALEELKNKDQYNKNNGGNLDKIKGILGVMTEGLQSDTDSADHYKLDEIIKKLTEFILTLRKEYIFAYPVVTCTAKAKAGTSAQSQPQPQALTTASPPSAKSILQQLKSVMLPCPSDFHNEASVCTDCYNVFAYILLGQVPKLYHSFRFMSWMLNNGWKVNAQVAQQPQIPHPVNNKITAYLVSMGFDNDKIQNVQSGVGTQLHSTFKSALDGFKQRQNPSPPATTHEPKGLKEIHEKLEELLKGLLQAQHDDALQSIAKGATDTRRRPRTIRDMLHWLSGVPFSVVYEDMKKFSNSLCDLTKALKEVQGKQVLKHNLPPEPILYRLGVSCAECLDVLQAIEDPLGKEPTKRFKAYIKAYDFYYPASASQLFYMFVDIIYNVYVQMKFVCNMTGRPKEEGGWERCEFVSKEAPAIYPQTERYIQCKCPATYVEYNCPRPLHRLLCSVSTVFTGKSLGFQLPKEKLYNARVVGSAIHDVIKHIFGSSNNYSVLCRLLLAVSSCPPTSIGDMIAFLYWYRNKMFPSGPDPTGRAAQDAQKYKNALHHEIELFPGTFDPRILTNALGALMNAHGAGGSRSSGNKTHTHNMLSILDCYGTAEVKTTQPQPQPQPQPQAQHSDVSCAPYLRPLAYDIYKIYVPQFSRAYLSWILHFGPRVYTALEEIKGKLNGSCSHCSDPQASIVTCNAVLPELYSKGLDFWDPKILNGQKINNGTYQSNEQSNARKTCALFATQLGEVLTTCSPGDPTAAAPLHKLIEAIEQFLWSIRLPFSLVQLSLWSVALLFISYVFVVPLDHFKIKSHLFNRLKYTMHPSLLIADGQRKVTEVAYFSL